MPSAGRRHGQRRRMSGDARQSPVAPAVGEINLRHVEAPATAAHPPTSDAPSSHLRRRSPNGVALSDSAIRIAARLRAAKNPEKRLIAFLGLTDEDGSSVAASQTAEALALMGLGRVVLVDGNLRAPQLHRLHGIPETPGLLELLRGQAGPGEVEHAGSLDNLFIVPTAEASREIETDANITSLLTGEAMTRFVERLRSECRFVVFDLAPAGRVADGSLLASLTDAVIIVVARGKRSRTQLLEARRGLEAAGAAVLGVAFSERR